MQIGGKDLIMALRTAPYLNHQLLQHRAPYTPPGLGSAPARSVNRAAAQTSLPVSYLGVAFVKETLLNQELSEDWSDGGNEGSCRCVQS